MKITKPKKGVYRIGEDNTYLDIETVNGYPMLYFITKETYWDITSMFKKYVMFGWLSMKIQMFLYKRKIYWHDWVYRQCTPGFECCRHLWEGTKYENIVKGLVRMSEEEIPIDYFNI